MHPERVLEWGARFFRFSMACKMENSSSKAIRRSGLRLRAHLRLSEINGLAAAEQGDVHEANTH